MALFDRLAAAAILTIVRPFKRVFFTLLGGSLLYLALFQLIIHTVNRHPSARFVTSLNIACIVVVGSAVIYVGLVSPILALTAGVRSSMRAKRAARDFARDGALGSASWG